MRCTKKLCIQLAVDGTNYCPLHLKLKGAPRPGISNSRSASGTRAEKTVGNDSSPPGQSGWALANKRKQPMAPERAKTVACDSPAARKGKEKDAALARGVHTPKPKSRG